MSLNLANCQPRFRFVVAFAYVVFRRFAQIHGHGLLRAYIQVDGLPFRQLQTIRTLTTTTGDAS